MALNGAFFCVVPVDNPVDNLWITFEHDVVSLLDNKGGNV